MDYNCFDISLHDVRFFARHGVFAQERILGNEFEVNLTVRVRTSHFDPERDELADTVSYADIYEVVREEMMRPRRLLESVCMTTARSLRRRFPSITEGRISIVKMAPPIPGINGTCGVEFSF